MLLHGCSGSWRRIDERWGKLIASWGYVTLTVDRFGPRGLKSCLQQRPPIELRPIAYRALNFLVRHPSVDPARVAVLGFSQGGWLALLVGRARPHRTSIARQIPRRGCLLSTLPGFKGNMTVPTLILVGELDDWTPAEECRNLVEGRDDWGISRQKGRAFRSS